MKDRRRARVAQYAERVNRALGLLRRIPPKQVAAACLRWEPVAHGVGGHETELAISQWNDLRLRVAL